MAAYRRVYDPLTAKNRDQLQDPTLGNRVRASINVLCRRPAYSVVVVAESRTPHLWKFMRALLEDCTYNPALIRWECRSEGVFRIVPGQSRNVARLWGAKKNNPTMTFDKLSRSLR